MPSEPKLVRRNPKCPICGSEETIVGQSWKQHYGTKEAPEDLHTDVSSLALNDKSLAVNQLLVTVPYLIMNWDVCTCGIPRVTSAFIQVVSAAEQQAAQTQARAAMLKQMKRS